MAIHAVATTIVHRTLTPSPTALRAIIRDPMPADPPSPSPPRPQAPGIGAFTGLALVCSSAFGALWVLEYGRVNPLAVWSSPRTVDTLTSFAEVTVGVLGVAITVVAIIVELAANRYTPRITELFVRDPVNVSVMSFFVVTSVLVLWIDLSLYGPHHPTWMALAAATLMSVSLLVLLPYFSYVFHFLSPGEVIRRIQRGGAAQLVALARGRASIAGARAAVVYTIEQLGDIAMASVDKKDKPLTLAAVEALAEVAHDAIRSKKGLPSPFFDTAPLVRHDQDFIALHPDMVRALTSRRTWLEMKVLRQYQAVFGEAVNRMRDVNHLIAIHTRQVAATALAHGDQPSLRLSVRFMNTYLRATINARDVRSAYNLLNEYRVLAEEALAAGDDELVLDLAEYIKFYGQLAFAMNLAFLLETAAYDLCTLLERASEGPAPCHDDLLAVFLDVDREPEADANSQEASLRGVRKAQIKLATHYLATGRLDDARRIFEDMRAEKPERMRSIRAELERVEEAEYWEVSDRGINFEWLAPERRAQLDTFFGWFPPS